MTVGVGSGVPVGTISVTMGRRHLTRFLRTGLVLCARVANTEVAAKDGTGFDFQAGCHPGRRAGKTLSSSHCLAVMLYRAVLSQRRCWGFHAS